MEALTPIHWEAVPPVIREMIPVLGQFQFMRDFYLAGGTALALHIGHRLSVDLDFFSEKDEVHQASRSEIIRQLAAEKLEVIENVDGNLLLLMRNVHAGFFRYGYPLLQATKAVENVGLASIVDIGLMKLDALIGRGGRKDFYDLYFISQTIGMADLLELSQQKYPGFRDFPLMALESMALFDNADRDRQPNLLLPVPWEEVKRFFIDQVKQIGNAWL